MVTKYLKFESWFGKYRLEIEENYLRFSPSKNLSGLPRCDAVIYFEILWFDPCLFGEKF